ncbi:hypothetical protein V5O48_013012 [Marasmius crinis-equi]|uniref:G-protein coupled receptors family 2 profile 2 domain-containing protein n=1 Tax=Marasmius crinis-equi TaxID=585013 RepID=A0ABR3F1E2_9AGAR
MSSSDGFVFTDRLVDISNNLWAITGIVGAVLCGLVVLVIGIIALNPVSRPHLDRVSFRILVCALLANTVFGITNAVGGKFTGPTWWCGFTIWLLQLTLEMSSLLLFSIALNLQLVVVHRVNGKKMERFYIFGSIIFALCLTVPPYAAKQYGWDPLVLDCWYSNPNQKERLAWQIGTQLFWTGLFVAGEFITSFTVVIYMIHHQVRRNRLQTSASSTTGSRTRSRSGSVVAANNQVAHANVYRGIIFRIVLYPIASALMNLTSVVCVIHATKEGGVHNWTGYRILLLSDFVYGGRAVVYALLAATDPALVRAAKAFIQHSRGKYPMYSSGLNSTLRSTESKNQNLSVHIELSTIHHNDSNVVGESASVKPSDPPTSHGYTDHFDTMIKPRSDIEEAPLDVNVLDHPDPTQGPRGGHPSNQRTIRVESEMARRQQEALERERDRQEFQKQI